MLRGEFTKPYWPELQAFVAAERSALHRVPAGRGGLRRPPPHSLRGDEGADPRPGPVPRAAPGARAVLLGAPGRGPPAVARQHPRRAADRPRHRAAGSRQPRAWAHQGVLLLNATLTVRAGTVGVAPGPRLGDVHRRGHPHGVGQGPPGRVRAVGCLRPAEAGLVDTSRHTIIESAHPSPLSAHNGFFGRSRSRGERRARRRLDPVDWRF